MTVKEWQASVDLWIRTVGKKYFDPLTNTALLAEETGEVARLMARIYGQQSFKRTEKGLDPMEALSNELADLLFVLTCIANQCDIDLEKALEKTLEKKTRRDKRRHKENKKLD